MGISVMLNHPLVPPLSAGISVTSECNSKCLYCAIWRRSDPLQPSSEELKDCIDQLEELGVQRVSLSGGEPFMRRDLPEIIAYARLKGLVVHVSTNGTLVTRERADAVAEAGLNYLTYSIDTLDPTQYQLLRGMRYDVVKRWSKTLYYISENHRHVTISINCVISKVNLRNVIDLVSYASDHGIWVSLQPIHIYPELGAPPDLRATLSVDEEMKPLLDSIVDQLIAMKEAGAKISSSRQYMRGMKDFLLSRELPGGFRCVTGFDNVKIDYNLNVKACWMLEPVGSLREQSLKRIWTSAGFRRVRRRMLKGDCPGCWLICHTEKTIEKRKREIRQFMDID
jgi:MoaA/NifB/PqqE/SkfB family radical SAM enzyme